MITQRLAELIQEALQRAAAEGLIEAPPPQPFFERPRKREHGDWATNVALTAQKSGGNPRSLAEALIERLPDSDLVARVEVAGPGFLNFHLAPSWLHDVVRRAADPQSGFGRSNLGSGTRLNVEYVSANPTGPINVVSGRHAAVGDTISKLLEATGHAVTREYYINDTGRQVMLFARSIETHYLKLHGRDAELPEDGYQGEYVAELAGQIGDEIGDELLDVPEDERVTRLKTLGLERMLASIKESLARFGTNFDVWLSEASLYESGEVEDVLGRLREHGSIDEKEGAVWFRSSEFGDDKDRVVIRANGKPTYLASDIGYLSNKFGRGFDRLIYQWGADHHGTVPRLLAAADALGFGRDRVEVRLVQVVSLLGGGQTLKASKRKGVMVTLDDLVSDVGVDAARYTFLTRSIDQPLDFDIELVKEQAPENPVYYVQYAHARICSILRKAAEEGLASDPQSAPLEVLAHPSEDELMRKLASYEEEVPEAAQRRAPQRITRYVEELAATFSAFYRDCRVISDDADATQSRLALCVATKAVIADALGLLGVAAPERM